MSSMIPLFENGNLLHERATVKREQIMFDGAVCVAWMSNRNREFTFDR